MGRLSMFATGSRRYSRAGLIVFSTSLALSMHGALAAAPAPAKPGVQSSEDVLKWLQMSGGKAAASDSRDSAKPARDVKETSAKSPPPTPAATPVRAATQTSATASVSPAASIPAPQPALLSAPVVPAAATTGGATLASIPELPVSPAIPIAERPQVATAIAPATLVDVPLAVAAPAPSSLRVLLQGQPKFPAQAQNNGILSGRVKALVHVAADGTVSKVEILEATPKRTFDGAVIAAVMRWKYAPMANPETTEVVFAFSAE